MAHNSFALIETIKQQGKGLVAGDGGMVGKRLGNSPGNASQSSSRRYGLTVNI